LRHTAWGEHYCRCVVEQYEADKVAPLPPGTCTIATEVFDIAELRELILSFLPMIDIAWMERVNKAWQTSVRTSPQLRRELFQLPLADPVNPKRITGDEDDHSQNDSVSEGDSYAC